jgi:putative aldouronate transport system permease protein
MNTQGAALMMTNPSKSQAAQNKAYRVGSLKKDLATNGGVYIIALPVLIYFLVFNYIPMSGLLMAFERYTPIDGIFGSKWVGFENFANFFNSYYFERLLGNTLFLSMYDIVVGFSAPIILALLLNEVVNRLFKSAVQSISYMPYFISTVVVAGLIVNFCEDKGVLASIYTFFTGQSGSLLSKPGLFPSIYVFSGVWQLIGFMSIIYLAAITAIDQEMYEAAAIDGAGRLKMAWHITLPGLIPTIVILLILRIGSIMNVSFDKILLIYNPAIYSTSDVIGTFVYRKGLMENDYSYSTAVGLFNSVISVILLVSSNYISRKASQTSLF